jgi:lysozyme
MNTLVRLIKAFEGLRLRAYLCPAGIWTIGYGATGRDIVPGLVWTREQAEARMQADAAGYLAGARRLCPGLSGERLEAVADFAYNLGLARLAGSTLRKRINNGDISGASEEFEKWVFCGATKLQGLVARRHAEKLIFLK